ncbi:MAG TPA: hypothetical protein VI911_10505 [Patescibacteria group bacterium]|nr:hypothetical protein [Patescibacteria group bacterium]
MQWKTKEGKIFEIDQMTNDHLKNARKNLKKRFPNAPPFPRQRLTDCYDEMKRVLDIRKLQNRKIKKSLKVLDSNINLFEHI